MEKCCIAIAGRTNSGKTTLFRCLTQKFVGEVKDKANVTRSVCEESGEMNVIYRDLPGFQEAGRIHDAFDFIPQEEIIKYAQTKGLELDAEAIIGLQGSDVVYYVIPLDIVPDNAFLTEIELVKKYNQNIIGILNKGSSQQILKQKNRTSQWIEFCENENIPYLEYDLHWDKPSKQIELAKLTLDRLDCTKKQIFEAYLKSVTENNDLRRQKIAGEIVDTMSKCRSIQRKSIQYGDYEDYKSAEDVVLEAKRLCGDFYKRIGKVYSIGFTDEMIDTIDLSVHKNVVVAVSKTTKRVQESLDTGAGGAVLGGAGGLATALSTMFGYGISMTFLGFLAIPLALAAVGAAAGGIYGAAQPQNDTLEVSCEINEADLFVIYQRLIAAAWCISYWGFDSINVSEDKSQKINYMLDFEVPLILHKLNLTSDNYSEGIENNTIKILQLLDI